MIGVAYAAIFRAHGLVTPRRFGFDPEAVNLAGDRIHLACQSGYPEAVDHVGGRYVDVHRAFGWNAHHPFRTASVFVTECPTVIVGGSLDPYCCGVSGQAALAHPKGVNEQNRKNADRHGQA